MKSIHMPLEYLIPLCIPIVAGLLLWGIKGIINSIKKSALAEVEKRLAEHDSRITATEIKANEAKEESGFLMRHLIERKS